MVHDWVRFPELTNSQMGLYYFESPHKQIMEDFRAEVIKVMDADTIRVRWKDRDFDFPVRFLGTDAPELNTEGGKEAQSWLENIILDEEVDIIINPRQRVGKWGRILGTIFHKGINLNEESIRSGMAVPFGRRREAQIPNMNEVLRNAII